MRGSGTGNRPRRSVDAQTAGGVDDAAGIVKWRGAVPRRGHAGPLRDGGGAGRNRRYARSMLAALISAIFVAPTCRMIVSNSRCMMPSTPSTPGWPKAARPQT